MFDPNKLLQIGIVVKNLEAAVDFYENTLGIGPFTKKFELNADNTYYYGEKAHQHLKLAMGHYGPLVIELIEVLEGKTVHADFLQEKGEGVDHICFQVEDLDATLRECQRRGLIVTEYVPVGQASKPGRGFAYIDADKIGGMKIELIQMPEGDSLI